jgi:hypothetical protein
VSELISSLQYIHKDSIGILEECKNHAGKTSAYLKEKYYNNEIIGVKLKIIVDRQMIDEYYILSNPAKMTNGVFPFIFLAVQHQATENKTITQWVKNNGYIEVVLGNNKEMTKIEN